MHKKDKNTTLEMLHYTPGFTEIKIPISVQTLKHSSIYVGILL